MIKKLLHKAVKALLLSGLMISTSAIASVPLAEGAQAPIVKSSNSGEFRIAYMPPATEFNYYIAIKEGVDALAREKGVNTFMLAPQSGADINGQMGMIQDVITQGVDAIIISTHDEAAAAPLIRRAVANGIVVVILTSDVAKFPTPVHAVVGYSQRTGTDRLGNYLYGKSSGSDLKIGIIEGQPGYHSTERVGGFLAAIEGKPGLSVVASIPGGWNVEGGNTAAMDLLQSNPEINAMFAANDYMIMGAALAAKALGRDILLFGNDGDTAALEQIHDGAISATVNTSPFTMGKIALQVTLDILAGKSEGGFVETPTTIVDQNSVLQILKDADSLYPRPSKVY